MSIVPTAKLVSSTFTDTSVPSIPSLINALKLTLLLAVNGNFSRYLIFAGICLDDIEEFPIIWLLTISSVIVFKS